jgi:preprotein translocase subunit SecY
VFRFGTQIPIFGINSQVFKNIAGGNNIIGFLDMFSGGALGNVSIFALGIGPYITASIIMQLLAVVIPHLENLQKEEGEAAAPPAAGAAKAAAPAAKEKEAKK